MAQEALIRAPEDAGALCEALERLVCDLIECYEGLERVGERRMAAIRGAKARELSASVREENELVQRVAELEKHRVAIVGAYAKRMGSEAKVQTKLSWIAERLEGEAGERIGGLVERLRVTIQRVQGRNEVAQEATVSLAMHMRGLLRKVAEQLNHARTYGRGGLVEPGARVMSALDVRS